MHKAIILPNFLHFEEYFSFLILKNIAQLSGFKDEFFKFLIDTFKSHFLIIKKED